MFERIKEIIINQLNLDIDQEIHSDTAFDSMDIDSIDAVEIIMAIEDEFEIEIEDDEAQNFNSISDIIDYLTKIGVE